MCIVTPKLNIYVLENKLLKMSLKQMNSSLILLIQYEPAVMLMDIQFETQSFVMEWGFQLACLMFGAESGSA